MKCTCPDGYHLNETDAKTCNDIDECRADREAELNCRATGGSCHNTQGSYECVCPAGFRSVGTSCTGNYFHKRLFANFFLLTIITKFRYWWMCWIFALLDGMHQFARFVPMRLRRGFWKCQRNMHRWANELEKFRVKEVSPSLFDVVQTSTSVRTESAISSAPTFLALMCATVIPATNWLATFVQVMMRTRWWLK